MDEAPPRRGSLGQRLRASVDEKTAPGPEAAPVNYNADPDHEKGLVAPVDGIDGKPLLMRALMGRHMQMIAIGGSIGAGLFVGSGSSLSTGGPGPLLLGFIIVGIMVLCMTQALGELAVIYPVNGAFFAYSYRFIDRAWGFAMGWEYAISWLTTLPFEITAAGITIEYWRDDLDIGIWIAVFLTVLIVVQYFGVRGYGEVEFFLSTIKIIACIGFIILGIIIDTGGVPTDDRGYIGGRYWHDPGAFRNGFKGFCSVFVNAAFAFGGTEMVGLAAAEANNPRKSIPRATKQVFWRITGFYVLNSLMIGLVVPSDSNVLLNSSGANTKASPFVYAIELAGIKGLPSVMNAVITISVLSVANSCTYGSTRTLQALAERGMGPEIIAYIDKKGRPLSAIVLQVLFGFLAFINEASVGTDVFNWLLALSGLSYFFTWGSICLSHIRFRYAWTERGRSLNEIPWRSPLGIWGSYCGLILVILCLMATFYVALFPVGADPDPETFFQSYLALPIVLSLWAFWKLFTRDWTLWIRTSDMDLDSGRREFQYEDLSKKQYRKGLNTLMRVYHFAC